MNAADLKLRKLMHYVPHEKFEREWMPFLAMASTQWTLPTEVVIGGAGLEAHIPNMARTYATHLYVFPSDPVEIGSYEELVEAHGGPKKFKGTGHFEQVYLCEVHEDAGDDGHVYYQLTGWCFAPESAFEEKAVALRRLGPRPAPRFMLGASTTDDQYPQIEETLLIVPRYVFVSE